MTPREVRRHALSLAEAEEHAHGGRLSFQVRERTFARLWPKRARAYLKLSRYERGVLARARPKVFKPTPRGRHGWTSVDLRRVDAWLFEELLVTAWRRVAPRRAVTLWNAARAAAVLPR